MAARRRTRGRGVGCPRSHRWGRVVSSKTHRAAISGHPWPAGPRCQSRWSDAQRHAGFFLRSRYAPALSANYHSTKNLAVVSCVDPVQVLVSVHKTIVDCWTSQLVLDRSVLRTAGSNQGTCNWHATQYITCGTSRPIAAAQTAAQCGQTTCDWYMVKHSPSLECKSAISPIKRIPHVARAHP